MGLYSGTQFASCRCEPIDRLLKRSGGTMKAPMTCGLLIVFAALSPAQKGMSEERSRRVVPVRSAPKSVGRPSRARAAPSIPRARRTIVPPITVPGPLAPTGGPKRVGRAAAGSGDEKPLRVEPPQAFVRPADSVDNIAVTCSNDSDESETAPVETDADEFLLPVWNPGFWAMPPGGLTRYLIPSRTFVDPDLAGCAITP